MAKQASKQFAADGRHLPSAAGDDNILQLSNILSRRKCGRPLSQEAEAAFAGQTRNLTDYLRNTSMAAQMACAKGISLRVPALAKEPVMDLLAHELQQSRTSPIFTAFF